MKFAMYDKMIQAGEDQLPTSGPIEELDYNNAPAATSSPPSVRKVNEY
jgi:hypothetical protein